MKIERNEAPIRVLHVLGALNIGGAETMVMNLYRNIDREKVQFDFVIHTTATCDFSEEVTKMGGKIYHCPRYIGYNHMQYCKWWKEFWDNHMEYKIIHGHVRSTAVLYLNIAKKRGIITISHSHSTSNGSGITSLIKNAMQYPIRYIADYMFACSDEAGIWLFGKEILTKSNYKLIPNAIDFRRFAFQKHTREVVRQQLGICPNDFVIGHVGRFMEAKNQIFLLHIFQTLKASRKKSKLLFVGDGTLKSRLEAECKSLGIAGDVIFTGAQADTQNYYQAMDIFVFPSRWEGLGIAVIEAQANGLTCIVSDKVPVQVKISDKVQFLPLNAPERWVEILEKSQGRSINFNCNGDRFDIRKIAMEMQEFYREIDHEQRIDCVFT